MKGASNLRRLAGVLAGVSLASCAATSLYIEKKDLDVQTRMSDSIMLPPADAGKMSVWTSIRNTSDRELKIEGVRSCLSEKGYRLASDPAQAHYLLQINILQFGKISESAARQSLLGGYGGVLAGGAAGALAGGAVDGWMGTGYGALGGGLLGGLIETVANASVKDVLFAGITDVQISERSTQQITRRESSSVRQGSASMVDQSAASSSDRFQYRTRVVSLANKVNLDYPEAQPHIERSLARSICGIF